MYKKYTRARQRNRKSVPVPLKDTELAIIYEPKFSMRSSETIKEIVVPQESTEPEQH